MRRPPRSSVPILSLLLLTVFLGGGGRAAEVPYLAGRVNDNAGILSTQTVLDLEDLLKKHEDSTSNQVVVLTVAALEGEAIEEYSLRVAESWKLGRKGKDNGVLLLVARDDRKVRIEVGTGLEGALPDIVCGQIIRNEIVPRFRSGEYDAGVTAGVRAILAAIRGEYTPETEVSGGAPVFPLLFGGLIFILVVGTFTLLAVFSEGCMSWGFYLFLIPFWFGFPVAMLGRMPGLILLGLYLVGFPLAKYWLGASPAGKAWKKSLKTRGMFGSALAGGFRSGSGTSGGGSGGGFSGGGGGFSGGGASGGW